MVVLESLVGVFDLSSSYNLAVVGDLGTERLGILLEKSQLVFDVPHVIYSWFDCGSDLLGLLGVIAKVNADLTHAFAPGVGGCATPGIQVVGDLLDIFTKVGKAFGACGRGVEYLLQSIRIPVPDVTDLRHRSDLVFGITETARTVLIGRRNFGGGLKDPCGVFACLFVCHLVLFSPPGAYFL